ncbi:hypothetical protein [Bacillus massilinigeriensis]|uniref:hypothetical protein n=1 Tax=Bacillus massilionigeriensis TaxID=1805475 RepID=UPI00096B1DCD|nr:hypothetical protein [Bacillus massilionigeriensis]
MTYIIENVNLLKSNSLEKTSLLIKNEKIAAIRPDFNRYTYMKMNAESFIMTPPHITLDTQIPLDESFPFMKNYFIKEMIQNGCTTFLTYFKVDHEYLFESCYKEMKIKLLNSPIDYILGIKIPQRLLTPTLIRKCKKMKIPVIFVEIKNIEDLRKTPWGWIKEALFPYNCPLAPIFIDMNSREKQQAKTIWVEILKKERIPGIFDELMEKLPIQLDILKKIGIYPLKSFLNQGGEVSYNFYKNAREVRKIEELELFLYHKHRLIITVHKGTIIRSGEEVLFRPGFGEHVTIKTPSIFNTD